MEDYKLRIITPDRVFYEGTADMIEFNTTEGEIGVLPGHIPMTVIIKPGVLTITEKDEVKEAADFVTGSNEEDGLVQVIDTFILK